ncbi:hypothetical protein ABT373_20775 [Streptomyces sp. NPDC000070]|uniref:hypothetical protein n=1 Tax=Streptomyces sp. NPDC000070 TaxID=3154240 RepID=UPI0033213E9D
MVETERARRILRVHAERLALTATDVTLPHPVPDTLGGAVDDIAARFPSHSGSLPRTPAPAPAVDEERLLLATATAHPADVEQMRWLTAGDFTHPLHARLWQCLTALTQQRGLLTSGADSAELLDLLGAPAGSPQYWGERILQRSLLTTAHHVGRRIEAFTDDPATTPYQLVIGSHRPVPDRRRPRRHPPRSSPASWPASTTKRLND